MKRIFCLILLFSFFVTGCNSNEGKFNKLEQELTNFLNDANESNYLTFYSNVRVNYEHVNNYIRMMADPIYFETYVDDDVDYIEIITQENDKVFEYKVIDNWKVDRTFLGYIEDNSISETKENVDLVELTYFNKQKCRIKINDNTYTITGLYKDLIDNESKEMFEEIFKGEETLLEELFNTNVYIKYIFGEENLKMVTSLTFKYEDIPIYIEISYSFYISPFDPINIYDGSYIISNPTSFEEAYELENLDEGIKCKSGEIVYSIVELEKGMLVANNKDASFSLYDMNKNLVSESLSYGNNYINKDLYPYMEVPKKGKYYLATYKTNDSHENVSVTLYEYETILSDYTVNLNCVSDYEGEIEGKYDFERFVYNKKENAVEKSIKIGNTGNSTIYLYRFDSYNDEGLICIKPNSYYQFYLKDGENGFYICQNFLSDCKSMKIDYSLKFELVD